MFIINLEAMNELIESAEGIPMVPLALRLKVDSFSDIYLLKYNVSYQTFEFVVNIFIMFSVLKQSDFSISKPRLIEVIISTWHT